MSVWPSFHQQSIVISQSVAWKLQFLCACHNIDRWESSKKNVWPHWYWYILNLKYKDVCINAKSTIFSVIDKNVYIISVLVTYITLWILKWIIVYSFYCAKVGDTYTRWCIWMTSQREKSCDRLNIFFQKKILLIIYIYKKTIKRGKFVFYLQFYCIVALLLTLWVKCRVLGSLHSVVHVTK